MEYYAPLRRPHGMQLDGEELEDWLFACLNPEAREQASFAVYHPTARGWRSRRADHRGHAGLNWKKQVFRPEVMGRAKSPIPILAQDCKEKDMGFFAAVRNLCFRHYYCDRGGLLPCAGCDPPTAAGLPGGFKINQSAQNQRATVHPYDGVWPRMVSGVEVQTDREMRRSPKPACAAHWSIRNGERGRKPLCRRSGALDF